MLRRWLLVFLLLVWAAAASHCATAATPRPGRFDEAPYSEGAEQVELGHSALALMGPWKFRLGNDPAWAQPGYDDSGWENYTIERQGWATGVFAFGNGNDAGWAGHGHRGQWGFGWYRLHVRLQGTDGPISLLMPMVDSAYIVYWDGTRVGRFGDPERQRGDLGWPRQFRIPPALATPGEHVVAIEVWDRALKAISDSGTGGGLLGAPLLTESEIGNRLELLVQRSVALQLAAALISELLPFTVVGILSLVLFLYNRRKREYLWIGLAMLTANLGDTVLVFGTRGGAGQAPLFAFSLADAAEYVFVLFSLLASLWLLGLENRRAMRYAIVASWGLYYAFFVLAFVDQWYVFSPQLFRLSNEVSSGSIFLMLAVLAWIAIAGIRARGAEGWLMLSPWLLTALAVGGTLLVSGHLKGFTLVAVAQGLQLLVPLSVLAILAYRFLRQWRTHQSLLRDRAEAQAVQQVVVSGELPQTPGVAIEAEYRPAQEVGGDFFQVLANRADGSVLIVVGDVTGKGLQAAMLVALIVGAIRASAETSSDPQALLEALNRRLCGNGHAQATCLVLRLERDGRVRLANAGHLPPWSHGAELEVAGSVPLGMVDGVEYEEQRFQMRPGERWTLVSDGVVEATNARRELFGFERVGAVSGEPAAAIAEAAQRFGQEDDITVLTVTYQPEGR